MSNDEDVKVPATWTDVAQTLAEGGLPQMIAGPAGKAISRLIAGVTDIPAAWLEQKAQRIKDETEARSAVVKAIAQQAAFSAKGDLDITQRALERYVHELTRKQENREAVAQKTIELLTELPAPETGSVPTDDWMNVFEEHAGKASSEKLRDTWARVLAGEIRAPSSFSLRTLQFLAVLDRDIAEATEDLLSRTIDKKVVILEELQGDAFVRMNTCRSVGLLSQLGNDSTTMKEARGSDRISYSMGEHCISAKVPKGASIELHCVALSPVATEIYDVVDAKVSEEAIAQLVEVLKRNAVVEVIARGLIDRSTSKIIGSSMVVIWIRSEQSKDPST